MLNKIIYLKININNVKYKINNYILKMIKNKY